MFDLREAFPEFVALGSRVDLSPGEYLWRENDGAPDVVLLLEGALEVIHEPKDEAAIVLRVLEPGAIVGEIAALDGLRRSAAVRAVSASTCLRFPAAAFLELIRQRSDLLEQLFWLQVSRVRSLTGLLRRTHVRAVTDGLTGLYNFAFFRDRLALEIARARDTDDTVALVLFDLDHFKGYNDRLGHPEGNEALRRVAQVLQQSGRRSDIVARYGGEEFVKLLFGAKREETVRRADEIRRRVEALGLGAGPSGESGLTISGGVAVFPDDAQDDAGLIEAADANLYKAKRRGRNQIVSDPR